MIWRILLVTVVSSIFPVCEADDHTDDGHKYQCPENRTKLVIDGKEFPQCCKMDSPMEGWMSSFTCDGGCCGERDKEYCCKVDRPYNDQEIAAIAGASVAGVILFIGLVVVLVCVSVVVYGRLQKKKDHSNVLQNVYTARNLDELFVPPQPLVSPPGTIVHPVTSLDAGAVYTRNSQPWVVPPVNQSQATPQSHDPIHRDDGLPDENEDYFERHPMWKPPKYDNCI